MLKLTKISILSALTMLIFTSCYTRRQCSKFCIADTITVNLLDTLHTNTIRHDTIIKAQFDTVLINKDKLQIKLIRVYDSIIIEGKCLGDTIYYERTIKVPYKLPDLTTLQKIKAVKYYILWVFIVGIAIGLFMQFRK